MKHQIGPSVVVFMRSTYNGIQNSRVGDSSCVGAQPESQGQCENSPAYCEREHEWFAIDRVALLKVAIDRLSTVTFVNSLKLFYLRTTYIEVICPFADRAAHLSHFCRSYSPKQWLETKDGAHYLAAVVMLTLSDTEMEACVITKSFCCFQTYPLQP